MTMVKAFQSFLFPLPFPTSDKLFFDFVASSPSPLAAACQYEEHWCRAFSYVSKPSHTTI